MRLMILMLALSAAGLAGCVDDAADEATEPADYRANLVVIDSETAVHETQEVSGQLLLASQGNGVFGELERDVQSFVVPHGALQMVATLDWDTTGLDPQTSDLDFQVRDHNALLVASGASLARPEVAQASRLDASGWGETWTTVVVNFLNPPTDYAVTLDFLVDPEATA